VDLSGGGGTKSGTHPSIAVSGTGGTAKVYIAYNKTGSELRLGTSTNGGTSFTDALRASDAADTDTSVAVSGSGRIGIVYQTTGGVLKYLYSDDGSVWNSSTVDTGGVGQYSSLKYAQDGTPVVAYYDQTNRKVKLAYFTGTVWVTSFIESAARNGEHAALGVSGNSIHVSYFDANYGDLKYAYASSYSSACSVTTVDADGITGQHTSIAVDGSGNPHIAYRDFSGALEYATKSGSNWSFVATPASVGAVSAVKTAIAIDASGQPIIGYVDATDVRQLTYRY